MRCHTTPYAPWVMEQKFSHGSWYARHLSHDYYFPMTHGAYGAVRSMGHGVYGAFPNYEFSMAHGAYGAILNYEFSMTHGAYSAVQSMGHGE